ncbi:uncharacterized protein LOC112169538 isoform X2 [Rosa chinensis]|uniref:uncharacterized protein LOC112169538 isoform X2 n=1 Tax=Rosa chinensis TaxID=74649 RepID=UPI001AD8D942|nr:uncharacterized protein LOC112169538 isoform X2 [Rosa chinensis]
MDQCDKYSKLANLQKGLTKAKAAPLLDKLVFHKIKQELGGPVRIMFVWCCTFAQACGGIYQKDMALLKAVVGVLRPLAMFIL